MQGILSGCKACFPALVFFFIITSVFIFFIWLAQKHPPTFKSVVITGFIAVFLTLAAQKYIFPRLAKYLPILGGGPKETEDWMIYDTDPRNDTFIKGRLNYRELKRLDAVLMKEKLNEGMAFDNITLNEVAKYDPKIIDAYYRWRKCKDMRRSYHKTIYPDERRLYHYLKE